MKVATTPTLTAIDGLAALVARVIERTGGPAPQRLDLWYLRRKPQRGLMAVFALPAADPPLACLQLAEGSMAGPCVRFGADAVASAVVTGAWPGIVRLPALGLTLQAFPEDADLAGLAEVYSLDPGGTAFARIRDALRAATGDTSLAPRSVSSEPLRYKPSDRCVLRLTARPGGQSVVAKLYADHALAASVHARTETLYAHQLGEVEAVAAGRTLGPPFIPRPLALLDWLGLTVAEDVRAPYGSGTPTVSEAAKLLNPRDPPGQSAETVATIALGLARLHAFPLPRGWPVRSAAGEADRAVRRAKQLAAYAPGHAERALALGEQVAERLTETAPATPRAAHGSFKPAQLLFRGDRLFITDFDQLCAADPALDVGYFLAYLRPSALWYRRRGARTWYEALEDAFLTTYASALGDLTGDQGEASRIAGRSHLYSAALLFKIANRRPNRLNSIRPGELDAMLGEIGACLETRAPEKC